MLPKRVKPVCMGFGSWKNRERLQRPPDGLNLPRLIWIICKRWNDDFLEKKHGLM